MSSTMPKITVTIENEQPTTLEQYEEQEVEITCPVATQDQILNESNKEVAIQDHSYGPTGSSSKRSSRPITQAELQSIVTGLEQQAKGDAANE